MLSKMKAKRAARGQAARLIAEHGTGAIALARAFISTDYSEATATDWFLLREVEKLLGNHPQSDTATRYLTNP